MSLPKDKALARIRTFANDVKKERGEETDDDRLVSPVSEETTAEEVVIKEKPSPEISNKTKEEKEPVTSVVKKPPLSTSYQKDLKQVGGEHVSDLQKEIDAKLPSTEPSVVEKAAPRKNRDTADHKRRQEQRSFASGDTTIITDTKRTSGGWLSKISSSIKTWWEDRKRRKQASVRRYAVPSADRRKGVIRTATTQSGAMFTADNDSLKEAILRRHHHEAEAPEITWTPNTDTGYALLDDGETDEPETTTKSQSTPPPAKKKPIAPPPVVITPTNGWKFDVPDEVLDEKVDTPSTPEVEQVPSPRDEVVPEAEPTITLAPEPAVPDRETEVATEPVIQTAPAVEPNAAINSSPSQQGGWREWLRQYDLNTNMLALGAVGVILTIVIVAFGVRAIVTILTPTDSSNEAFEIVLPITNVNEVIDWAVEPLTPTGFLLSVEELRASDAVLPTEVRFIQIDGSVLSPEQLVATMDLTIDMTFVSSINTLRLLALDSLEHALVMEVDDPLSVRGHLLEWETYMASDVDAILRLKPINGPSRFVDEVIDGRDVRVLLYDGKQILVYGFITDDIVVIARDTATFAIISATD